MSRVEFSVAPRAAVGLRGILTFLKFTKLLLMPVTLGLFVSACAYEGDFGRIEPTALSELTDEVLLNANIITRGINRPELNRDEIALREAGHVLARPLNLQPQVLDIPLRSRRESYDEREYLNQPIVPFEAIGRSLDRDHNALTNFGVAARRVITTYDQRMQSVLRYDPVLRAKRRNEARARLQQNFDYIDSVFTDFGEKLQAYHYAIGDARAGGEGPFISDLESSLAHLRDRTASLEYELTHYFGAVIARGEYYPARYATRWQAGFRRNEPPPPNDNAPYEKPRRAPLK